MMLLLKQEKKISFTSGKTSVSTEKDTESKGESKKVNQKINQIWILNQDESQDSNFSEGSNENHFPKQSSEAPLKGSLKVSDWVVVKYDIANSVQKVQFNIISFKY